MCVRLPLPEVFTSSPAAAAPAASVCATHQIRDLGVEPEVSRRPQRHRNRCSGGSESCHHRLSLGGGSADEEEDGGGDPQGFEITTTGSQRPKGSDSDGQQ